MADLLLPIRCEAMRRVSSAVSASSPLRSTPLKLPLTCTCNLRPGEKIRSLTLGLARSTAVSKSSAPEPSGATEICSVAAPGAAQFAAKRKNDVVQVDCSEIGAAVLVSTTAP